MPRLLEKIARAFRDRSDERLLEEIDELRERRSAFRKAHPRFRDTSHRAIDNTYSSLQTELDALLGELAVIQKPVRLMTSSPHGPLPNPLIERIGTLQAFLTTKDAAHAAVDAFHGFSSLTSAKFAEQDGELSRQINDRVAELRRRKVATVIDEAESDLADIEREASIA